MLLIPSVKLYLISSLFGPQVQAIQLNNVFSANIKILQGHDLLLSAFSVFVDLPSGPLMTKWLDFSFVKENLGYSSLILFDLSLTLSTETVRRVCSLQKLQGWTRAKTLLITLAEIVASNSTCSQKRQHSHIFNVCTGVEPWLAQVTLHYL